ncbi:MAG: response regulator [Deltaproteobacteria bacterium]|nr:MAG: response regulator [Deltaproteobacteria bacterium]
MAEKARILVIDDEKVILDSCTRILTEEGYAVKTAANGEIGIRLFHEFHPDLVLVDLKMPGKSGLEVLAEIEQANPDVVRIVITGYATVSSAVDSMKRGAYDFIPKPFTPDEMTLIISRGLERRQLLLEKQALRLEQEKTRRNMVSLVSHELRAPLAAAVQYLEVILGGMAGEISLDAKEMIDRCSIRLKELLDLLSRWLSLASFDPMRMAEHFTEVDLVEVARESIEGLKSLAEEKKVSLALNTIGNSVPIEGNKISLGEIFNNVIGNAIKYNKENGWVRVTVEERDQEVLIEIGDGGMGIKEEDLPRIFDEFYRVDGRRNAPIKGSGLGLAIVKRMVDAHGGSIAVESRLGEGTIVTIRLPRSPQFAEDV